MSKKCRKCLKIKPIKSFYKHVGMMGGHLNKCISCTKSYEKWRRLHSKYRLKIALYDRERFKDPKRKKKILEYQRKRRMKHKDKDKAREKTWTALKNGTIFREKCEVCGNIKSQAHHPDYRRPLKIVWLCFKHHRERHNQKVNYIDSKDI